MEANYILIGTNVLSLCALVISFFSKRQIASYDEAAKQTWKNKTEIEVVLTRLDRLEKDVEGALVVIKSIEKNYIKRFDDMRELIIDQFGTLSGEIKSLSGLVTNMRINCAAVGHSDKS